MNFPPQNITGLPEPDKASAEHSRKLAVLIHQVIEEKGGAIPFREFMDLALYAPALGYYVAGQHRFGADLHKCDRGVKTKLERNTPWGSIAGKAISLQNKS